MLPQLEAFLEVARLENLSRAAKSLYVSQPTLTARVQALESALGEQLFVRTRRGMRLTEAGEAFLPYAERSVQALRDGRELLGELRRGQAGKLVLGAPPTVSTYALPLLLTRFSAEHPGVRLAVKTGNSEEVLDMVLRDEVQLGLMRALEHPDLQLVPVYTDTLEVIAGPGHRLARRGQVRLAELAGEVLILFGRSSSYRQLTNAMFREAGVLPAGVMELDNIEAAKKMVERGLGISLVPHTAVRAELAGGLLVRVEAVDAVPVHRHIVAARRRDAGPPLGAVAAFLALLAELRTQLEAGPDAPVGPEGSGEPQRGAPVSGEESGGPR